jgi:hypothetical protein
MHPAPFEAKVNQAKADVESTPAMVLAQRAAVAAAPSDPSEPLRDLGRFPPVSPLRFRRSITSNRPINQG